ncbi:hypothetical protein [Streptomyces sp. NPDC023588]
MSETLAAVDLARALGEADAERLPDMTGALQVLVRHLVRYTD